MSGNRLKGTVKWFSNRKGYGFVKADDESKVEEEVFVHHTKIVAPEGAYRTLVSFFKKSFNQMFSQSFWVLLPSSSDPRGEICLAAFLSIIGAAEKESDQCER